MFSILHLISILSFNLFSNKFIVGFGSIDFQLFSDYYVNLGPLAAPYTLPSHDANDDIDLGDMMGNSNNEYNKDKINEKLAKELSSKKNLELILLTKCYVSIIILFICFILLIRTIRKCCLENRITTKRIGEYEILYTDSNVNEFSELGVVHKNTEIAEESKKTENGIYGSMSTKNTDPTTRKYFIQSDKKINVQKK
jgi:hypothetical protein